MTPDAFAHAIRELCIAYGGSVTSWGRTAVHNRAVGGSLESAHLRWLGADVIWDTWPDDATLDLACTALGLRVVREADHDHFQPADRRA